MASPEEKEKKNFDQWLLLCWKHVFFNMYSQQFMLLFSVALTLHPVVEFPSVNLQWCFSERSASLTGTSPVFLRPETAGNDKTLWSTPVITSHCLHCPFISIGNISTTLDRLSKNVSLPSKSNTNTCNTNANYLAMKVFWHVLTSTHKAG